MENLRKEFVPYEQALALKELGFDEPCFANMFDYSKSHINTDVPNRIRFYNVEFSKDFNKHYEPVHLIDTDIFVSISLYQQAFKWFREKHNWTIKINQVTKNNWSYTLDNFPKDRTYYGEVYKTYEEAELECLKKLIEIVKES